MFRVPVLALATALLLLADTNPTGAKPAKPGIGRQLVDINRAQKSQLVLLPGVGPAYADRIVAGRPYRTKEELVYKGILPPAIFERCRDLIQVVR
jgi:DNA uptake protein ComE-like DNA-binding protein